MVRTANFMTLLSGSPVNVLAGQSGSASVPPDMVWDWTNKALYICTQSSSNPLDTVWTEIEFVGPFVGTNVTCVSLTATGSIVDDGTLLVQGATTLGGPVTMDNNLTVDGSLSVAGPATVGPLTALQGGTLGGVFTGSPTFNFPLNMTQPISLANNVFITSADTAGAYRPLIGTDAGNNSFLRNAGGANTGILNQAANAWLILSDNAGNVQVPAGSFYSAGNVTTPNTVQGGYIHSTGNLQVDGAAQVNGQLNTYGGIYPHNGVYNIGGYAGFSLYLAGGNPTIQFAGGQYIQYNGNINYATNGNHNFTGNISAGGIYSSYLESSGNADLYGTVTVGTLNVNGGASIASTLSVGSTLTAQGIHVTGSFAADGPSVANSNFNIGGTTSIGGAGTIGGVGWYYGGTGANHGFQLWYNGSAYVRVDGATDILVGSPSDARLKRNIHPSKFDGLAAIRAIPLYEFEWLEGGRFDPIGFVAQEMLEVFPEAVYDSGKSMGINVNIVLAALCDAVQQLAARIQ